MLNFSDRHLHTIDQLVKEGNVGYLKNLEALVLANGSSQAINDLLNRNKYASVKDAENRIIELQDYSELYFLVRNNKKADVGLAQEAILKSHHSAVIRLFATEIKGVNLEKLQQAELELGSLDEEEYSRNLYLYAKDVKNADVFKISEKIASTTSSEWIFYFAKDIKGSNIEALEKAIIRNGNARFIYYFARYVKGANVEKLQKALLNTRYEKYLLLFEKNVKGANKEGISKLINGMKKEEQKPNIQLLDYDKLPLEERVEEMMDYWNNYQ